MIREYLEIYNRRDFIRLLVHGEIRASVQRTIFGTIWYTILPIMQIAIYYFLIVVIFQRGGSYGLNPFLVIAVGIMHFTILMQCGAYGVPAVFSNSALLLQVKIEPLILIASGFYKAVRTSLTGVAISLIIYIYYFDGPISYKLLFYPAIMVLWLLFCWIVVVISACATVYLRDLQRVIPFVFQILMYSSPVIYVVTFYPQRVLDYLFYSPPAIIFALFQWSLFGTPLPPPYYIVILLVTLILGFMIANQFYLSSRRGFTKAF